MVLRGLHHITCVCGDAQRTTDFYRDELGFSLVKKTVNFDDPHSYHLYFGDEAGSPGSLITFFEWPRAERGRLGRGTLESLGLVSPAVEAELELEDPDGLRLRLTPGKQPGLQDVSIAIGNPDLYAGLFAEDAPISFAPPVEETALIGAGITHHFAWRCATDEEQLAWFERLTGMGLRPTPVQDRKYFPLGLLPDARRDPRRGRDRRSRLPRRRTADAARPGALATAVAGAGAEHARARARADHLSPAPGGTPPVPPGLRMRWRGLEPPRPKGHKALNLARLPIPPPARGAAFYWRPGARAPFVLATG